MGGLRMDITARDEHGRHTLIEAQLGISDHAHLGQFVTYACSTEADIAIWAAATDDCGRADHLTAVAKLNERFTGQCQFAAVQINLESEPLPAPDPHARLHPRLQHVA